MQPMAVDIPRANLRGWPRLCPCSGSRVGGGAAALPRFGPGRHRAV